MDAVFGVGIGVLALMGLRHFIWPNITPDFYRGRFFEGLLAGILIGAPILFYCKWIGMDAPIFWNMAVECAYNGDYIGVLSNSPAALALTSGMVVASLVYFR